MDTKHTDLAEKIGRIIAPEAYLEDRAGVDLMPARYDAEQKTRAILALLEPEGWQLVPKEPTPEMIEKAYYFALDEDAKGVWTAMLSASPLPSPNIGGKE